MTNKDVLSVINKIKKQNLLWYLASPYSHPSENIRQCRFEDISRIAGILHQHKIKFFAPISMSHPITHLITPDSEEPATSFEDWRDLDLEFVSRCDGVICVTMPGWQISKGVTAELAAARKYGKQIMFLDPGAFLS